MPWSEIVLILGLSTVLGLPVLGFALYWTAEFLDLRVKERKQRLSAKLSAADAEALRGQIARLQAEVEQLRGTDARVERLEEQVVFLERLLSRREEHRPLPPPGGGGASGGD